MDDRTMFIAYGLRPLRGRAAHVSWANFRDPSGVLPCGRTEGEIAGLEQEIMAMLKEITT